MRNCMDLRPHAGARISLRKVRHSLLGTHTLVNEDHEIPTNALPLTGTQEPMASNQADLVIKNATLIDAAVNERHSVAISGDTVVFVGDDNGASPYITENTEIIDAAGRTILPGLCDSHFHLMVGAERLQGISVEEIESAAEFRKAVSEFASTHADAPVIHVYGLHYLDPPIIPAKTTRQFLDSIEKDRPLFVYAHDLHTGWANTKALEISGLLNPMPPFPRIITELDLDDNIELAPDGMPSGEFREPDVYFQVEGVLREKFPLKAEQKLAYLRDVLQKLSKMGLTSIHNMGLALPEEDIELLMMLLELEHRGELPLRIHFAYSVVPDEHMLTDIHYASLIRDKLHQAREAHLSAIELHEFLLNTMKRVIDLRHEHDLKITERHPHLDGHKHLPFIHAESRRLHSHINAIHGASHFERLEHLRNTYEDHLLDPQGLIDLGGVKLFMDGVIEKDTAFRLDQPPVEGIPGFNPEHLEQVVCNSDRAGLQVAAHCIGDGSVKAILNAVEVARTKNKAIDETRGHRIRHRIEHIELCDPADIDRFQSLDVTPSMQPLHERPPFTMWHQKVPQEKWPCAFPWKSLLDTGARLCFGSDWPIVSCNCFAGMRRATERKPWKEGMPDQHLSREEVVDNFSSHPAYLEYREKCKGQLKPGMLADLILLAVNLHDVRTDSLDDVRVDKVIFNGTETV